MVLKPKRLSWSANHLYMKTIEDLAQESNVLVINSNIDAARVINMTSAVISIPYTSTAFIGLDANKPSIFFDVMASLQNDEDKKNGVQVIDNFEDLSAWVANI